MGLEQIQWPCKMCQRYTLHTRHVQETPHLIHAIVTIFMCGCWLPIWITHSLVVIARANSEPYRCSQCGFAAGALTSAEAAAQHQARAVGLAAQSAQRAARRRARRQRASEVLAAASAWVRQVPPFLIALPGRFDRWLAILAGPGNTIIHGFLRLLALTIAVTAVTLVCSAAITLSHDCWFNATP